MRQRLVVLAVLLLAGCGVSKDEFAAQQRDAEQFKARYQGEAEKTAALERKVTEQGEQLTALQQKLTVREQENARLQAAATRLEEEKGALQAKSSQYEQLTASLRGQIQSGQVEISELRGKMTVKLKDKVLFASGSTALGKEGRAALDAVAEAFKDLQGKNVLVAGYTDDVPTGSRSGFKDNWDLSAARAVTVVRYLQGKGVAPAILGAVGFSEFRPLAGNDTAEGRSQNRRIEISIR